MVESLTLKPRQFTFLVHIHAFLEWHARVAFGVSTSIAHAICAETALLPTPANRQIVSPAVCTLPCLSDLDAVDNDDPGRAAYTGCFGEICAVDYVSHPTIITVKLRLLREMDCRVDIRSTAGCDGFDSHPVVCGRRNHNLFARGRVPLECRTLVEGNV